MYVIQVSVYYETNPPCLANFWIRHSWGALRNSTSTKFFLGGDNIKKKMTVGKDFLANSQYPMSHLGISDHVHICFTFTDLDHTADVQWVWLLVHLFNHMSLCGWLHAFWNLYRIHSWGNSLEEAFEQCAMGMFGYMTDTETVEPLDTVDVESEGQSSPFEWYQIVFMC